MFEKLRRRDTCFLTRINSWYLFLTRINPWCLCGCIFCTFAFWCLSLFLLFYTFSSLQNTYSTKKNTVYHPQFMLWCAVGPPSSLCWGQPLSCVLNPDLSGNKTMAFTPLGGFLTFISFPYALKWRWHRQAGILTCIALPCACWFGLLLLTVFLHTSIWSLTPADLHFASFAPIFVPLQNTVPALHCALFAPISVPLQTTLPALRWPVFPHRPLCLHYTDFWFLFPHMPLCLRHCLTHSSPLDLSIIHDSLEI